MEQTTAVIESDARTVVHGAVEGLDARYLAEAARRHGAPQLHVALDDARAARLIEALGFFDAELPVRVLPAWDCLPYDRVSPNNAIVSRRVDTLTSLSDGTLEGHPAVIVTTVNAFLQRVPPRAVFQSATLGARIGERVPRDRLEAFLANNGYGRTETVREPGEFALRGDIVDLFPPGQEEPLRLDFFDDELEAVRRFDPLSQRTIDKLDGFLLKPMSEIFLTEEAIQRFRSGYRDLFGAVTGDDPLYEGISAGRKQPGMEHWLPLFHDHMETIADYLPGAPLTIDHGADDRAGDRLRQIADFFEAREQLRTAERKFSGPVYKPLPPDRLYLTDGDWKRLTTGKTAAQFSPFADPGVARGEKRKRGTADLGGRRGETFSQARNDPDANVYAMVRDHAQAMAEAGRHVLIAAYSQGSRERLKSLLMDHGVSRVAMADSWEEARNLPQPTIGLVVLGMETGFVADDIVVLTEQDILGERLARPQRKRRRTEDFLTDVTSLSEGDLVVHMEHGIGRYEALETLDVAGAPHDCVRIVYDGGDKLFVPVESIEVLSRYGSEESAAQLDRLGGAAWQARKSRVKKRLKDMAGELLKIAAMRKTRTVEPVSPPDGAYAEFCAGFPYAETEDQLRTIEDVETDLNSGYSMDRLVCGDVGFGKTEVALRAAFIVAMAGQQVAVVVPTTLLARQHYRSFTERFRGLPVRIAQLSRLVAQKDARLVREELAAGKVDIIIGTHAILSKALKMDRLGLIIVDEEQHFGVKQKERLKHLRETAHVLTLTATPIPRTLQMALSGVRDLSIMATPPIDRLAVRTFVLPFDPMVIREAILREHFRGGQVFYVCPRVEDLPAVEERLRDLVPEVKLVTAHGQMNATELETRMAGFYDGQYDLLLSTNIIESGLDLPNANTLIVHRADLFGLAQLYQLRGRIGRGKLRGYAYMTYSPRKTITANAQRRLEFLETLDTLGAGFQLASYDLDLRGAGNLLGEEQSGQIREVGIELYQQMLEEAVEAARMDAAAPADGAGEGGEPEEQWTPQINLGIPVLIPETYVHDLSVRLSLYRRLSTLVGEKDIESFAAEMIDRFGPLPDEVENLMRVIAIKHLCRIAGIERLDGGPKGAVIHFRNNEFANVAGLMQFIQKQSGAVKLKPDHRLVCLRAWDDTAKRIKGAHRLARDLADLAIAG